MNAKIRLQIWFWKRVVDLLLWIEGKGYPKPRQVIHTPLIVLVLEVRPASQVINKN